MDLRILVSRADRIGDLVLTLPAIYWIKQVTGAEITLHCSMYARDVADWAKFNGVVDRVLFQNKDQWEGLPQQSFDLFLSFFHNRESVDLLKHLKIKKSYAPRTKLSSIFLYNKTFAQHRSQAKMSEMFYNFDLARKALNDHFGNRFSEAEFTGLPKLVVPEPWLKTSPNPIELIVSLSNGGSAKNWQTSDYVKWCKKFHEFSSIDFLIAGTDANERKKELQRDVFFDPQKHRVFETFGSVSQLIAFVSKAKTFIASSTGPLHLAHAAGVDVVGVYPKTKSESFQRWRPDGFWHQGEIRWIEIES